MVLKHMSSEESDSDKTKQNRQKRVVKAFNLDYESIGA